MAKVPQRFESPVETGGRVRLRTTRRDNDQNPGTGDDQSFGDVPHHAQSSHQIAGIAFEVIEKVATGSLVDVIPTDRDDDHAGGDKWTVPPSVCIRRALIAEFSSPVDF